MSATDGKLETLEDAFAEFEAAVKLCDVEIAEAVVVRDRAKENAKAQSRVIAALGKKRTSLLHALGRVDEERSRKRVKK
jgi:ATP phosphoribosyltransferase regulatory subunit HisZ